MTQVMIALLLPLSFSDSSSVNLLMQLETECGVGNADRGGGTAQVLLLQTGTFHAIDASQYQRRRPVYLLLCASHTIRTFQRS